MKVVRRIAQHIRHLPGLEGAAGVWSLLRGPYHWLLNAGGRGVEVMVGGNSVVSMPAEFAGGSWEEYEPETVAALAKWVKRHPGGIVLDVGSSIGIFSAVALFADATVEVVAFDSDLASLAAAGRLCQHARGTRLRLVHGLIGQTPTEMKSLAAAVSSTADALLMTGTRGDVGTTRYVCFGDPDIDSIPVRRLDDLFAADVENRRAMLIKCDVEGAEMLVLAGSEALLGRIHPDLLLSVHPDALPTYGHSVEALRMFLEKAGYSTECIAVDHEEHWWCTFNQ
jgi:FkbM family methyltransferase